MVARQRVEPGCKLRAALVGQLLGVRLTGNPWARAASGTRRVCAGAGDVFAERIDRIGETGSGIGSISLHTRSIYASAARIRRQRMRAEKRPAHIDIEHLACARRGASSTRSPYRAHSRTFDRRHPFAQQCLQARRGLLEQLLIQSGTWALTVDTMPPPTFAMSAR
jgi:hypothetical protein